MCVVLFLCADHVFLRPVSQLFEAQEVRDNQVLALATNVASLVEFVADVKQFARLSQLKLAIEEVKILVEDMCNLILARTSHGISR